MKRFLKILCCFSACLMLTPAAVNATGVSPVIRIAVIDTGISENAILSENLSVGKNYILPDVGTDDKVGHGTAIAGIIVGSEKAEISGICPGAVLVPLVYYSTDKDGNTVKGDEETLAIAICDAVDKYSCNIINISSSTVKDNEKLRKAVEYAEQKGVLIVAAAGDSEDTDAPFYPAAYSTVLSVGACNKDNTVSYFSPQNGTVDILAPGSGLRVLTAKETKIRADGTSYSAAYVSGTAAALLSSYPNLSPLQVREILYESAVDIADKGMDAKSGYGILNGKNAFNLLSENKSTETNNEISAEPERKSLYLILSTVVLLIIVSIMTVRKISSNIFKK